MHKCDKCDKEFDFKSRLTKHLDKCGKQQEYVCHKCNKKFENKNALGGHASNCGKPINYDKLKKMWNSTKSKITNDKTKTFTCICKLEFKGKQSYAAHKSHCKLSGNGNTRVQYVFTAEDHKKHGKTYKRKLASGEIIHNRKGKKLTEERKEKLRQSRIEYLMKKLGKTAWEKRNAGEFSYLEEWFDKKCIKLDLYSEYDVINEYCEYPYFIDFAFINEKIAVELDGKCHFTNGNERIQHDIKKDSILKEKGWNVYRIKYDEIETNEKIEELLKLLKQTSFTKKYHNQLASYKEYKALTNTQQ